MLFKGSERGTDEWILNFLKTVYLNTVIGKNQCSIISILFTRISCTSFYTYPKILSQRDEFL